MNARRGFVPDDERNFSLKALPILCTASRHVCYLINEGYDLKSASTFVGNHFLLSERQRLAVVRSVAAKEQIRSRRSREKTIEDLKGQAVFIDGFNEIITLEVMCSRSLLFYCMDGTTRDLAALRGTYRLIPETDTAVRLMLDVLEYAGVSKAVILLDQPVSNSGRLKTRIAQIGEEYTVPLDIRILRGVDKALYGKENVITSDSVILDHCRSWFNLTGECVRREKAGVMRVWEEEDQVEQDEESRIAFEKTGKVQVFGQLE